MNTRAKRASALSLLGIPRLSAKAKILGAGAGTSAGTALLYPRETEGVLKGILGTPAAAARAALHASPLGVLSGIPSRVALHLSEMQGDLTPRELAEKLKGHDSRFSTPGRLREAGRIVKEPFEVVFNKKESPRRVIRGLPYIPGNPYDNS